MMTTKHALATAAILGFATLATAPANGAGLSPWYLEGQIPASPAAVPAGAGVATASHRAVMPWYLQGVSTVLTADVPIPEVPAFTRKSATAAGARGNDTFAGFAPWQRG